MNHMSIASGAIRITQYPDASSWQALEYFRIIPWDFHRPSNALGRDRLGSDYDGCHYILVQETHQSRRPMRYSIHRRSVDRLMKLILYYHYNYLLLLVLVLKLLLLKVDFLLGDLISVDSYLSLIVSLELVWARLPTQFDLIDLGSGRCDYHGG